MHLMEEVESQIFNQPQTIIQQVASPIGTTAPPPPPSLPPTGLQVTTRAYGGQISKLEFLLDLKQKILNRKSHLGLEMDKEQTEQFKKEIEEIKSKLEKIKGMK